MEIPKLTKIILASLQGMSGPSGAGPDGGGADLKGVAPLSAALVEALGTDSAPGLPRGAPAPPPDMAGLCPLPPAALGRLARWVRDTQPAMPEAAAGNRTDQVRGYLDNIFRGR